MSQSCDLVELFAQCWAENRGVHFDGREQGSASLEAPQLFSLQFQLETAGTGGRTAAEGLMQGFSESLPKPGLSFVNPVNMI